MLTLSPTSVPARPPRTLLTKKVRTIEAVGVDPEEAGGDRILGHGAQRLADARPVDQ